MTFDYKGEPSVLRLKGYASLFGIADLSGDIVQRGAFSSSLLARESVALPMLSGHDTSDPIGVWDRVYEDMTGLCVEGRLLLGSDLANRAAHLVHSGAVTGLSIGYRVKRQTKTPSGRSLLDLDLWEVSVVAFPMLREARLQIVPDETLATSSPPLTLRSAL